MNRKVYIIILNWNGWQDTIECLESLLKIDYPLFEIVLIDNGSNNNSVEKILLWLKENDISIKRDLEKNSEFPEIRG